MGERLEIEEAVSLILSEINKIKDTEKVPLIEAFGRVIGHDIAAPFSVPSFPKAAMDGYAVRADEIEKADKSNPVTLTVIGEQLAGEELKKRTLTNVLDDAGKEDNSKDKAGKAGTDKTLGTAEKAVGTAVRIMTGARVPEGYDAVVRQEDTDYGEDEVKVYSSVKPYTNYCRVGEDIQKGDTAVKAGSLLGRIEAGILASLGIAEVEVVRKLKVDIISTGTELKKPGEPLGEYDIYNSIAYTLSAALRSPCFEVHSFTCGDLREDIAAELSRSLHERHADIIITTGGVSVGRKDMLPGVLNEIGAKRIFDHVNIKPGTPTIGSVLEGVPILGLSGNPYAAIVNFDIYFPQIAERLTGCDAFRIQSGTAVFEGSYDKVSFVRRMLRARVQDGSARLESGVHSSSVLSNLTKCNAYIDIPAGAGLSAGDSVKVIYMPEWGLL